MRNIITLLVLTFALTNCKAQQIVNITTFNQGDNAGKYFKDLDNHYAPFLGIWENTTTIGNLTFRVILHKTEKKPFGYPIAYYKDKIEGRFLMIENKDMPDERVIYDSVKYFPASGQTSENVILGGSSDGITMGAFIDDTTVPASIGIVSGNLTVKILNTGNTPLQAQWKVFVKGITIDGYDFNIPKDLILTKQ